MKARHIITIALAVTLLAIPGQLMAQGGPRGGPGMGGPGGFGGPGLHRLERLLPRLAEFLDLTAEQEANIRAILDEELPQIEAWKEQIRDERQAFHDSHTPGSFDEAEFRAFATAQAATHVEVAVATARTMSRVYNVLTPEQQDQLRRLMGFFHERGGQRRGGGRLRP